MLSVLYIYTTLHALICPQQNVKSEGRRPPSSRTFTPTGPSPYFSGCGDCHPISPGAQTSLVISATCGNRNSARLSRHFPGHITSRCSRVKRKTPSGRDSNPVPRTSHFVERAVYIHYAARSYMPVYKSVQRSVYIQHAQQTSAAVECSSLILPPTFTLVTFSN